jgi:phosphonoacetaldehyde hydrolase
MTHFRAVIFDWAGTVIDFGSFAPMGVFVEAFAEFGVEVGVEQARGPMGMPKRDHIAAMMADPEIAERWRHVFGAHPDEADIDRVYAVFVPMNEKVVAKYATLVPGAKDAIDDLRRMGLKIGSTTGYTRSIMAHVLPVAADQGYEPDNLVCSDDLIEGRPGPLGIYQCMVDLAVYPPSAIIKVDDTEPGIAEGVSAGCLTVGVSLSGNYVGKTPQELEAMPESDIAPLRRNAADKLEAAGADHVIDTIADLPDLVRRLRH